MSNARSGCRHALVLALDGRCLGMLPPRSGPGQAQVGSFLRSMNAVGKPGTTQTGGTPHAPEHICFFLKVLAGLIKGITSPDKLCHPSKVPEAVTLSSPAEAQAAGAEHGRCLQAVVLPSIGARQEGADPYGEDMSQPSSSSPSLQPHAGFTVQY